MYNKKKCSPVSNKHNKNKISCINKELLIKIQKALNVKYNSNTTILYNNISKKIKTISKCKTELCWMDINHIINNLSISDINELKLMFKPIMSSTWKKNKFQWLNTNEIENVLNQYSIANDDFYFYGASPSDYDNIGVCNLYNICNINIKKHIIDGIKRIAIVFNTDESNKPGKHWVCIYIDLFKQNSNFPSIYYFDSIGNYPQKNILKFINKVRSQKKMNFYYNNIKHQEKNTECGIYCIHFITYMLNNGDFIKYITDIKSDVFIHKFRSFYFNK